MRSVLWPGSTSMSIITVRSFPIRMPLDSRTLPVPCTEIIIEQEEMHARSSVRGGADSGGSRSAAAALRRLARCPDARASMMSWASFGSDVPLGPTAVSTIWALFGSSCAARCLNRSTGARETGGAVSTGCAAGEGGRGRELGVCRGPNLEDGVGRLMGARAPESVERPALVADHLHGGVGVELNLVARAAHCTGGGVEQEQRLRRDVGPPQIPTTAGGATAIGTEHMGICARRCRAVAPEDTRPAEGGGGDDWNPHPHGRHCKIDKRDGHPNFPKGDHVFSHIEAVLVDGLFDAVDAGREGEGRRWRQKSGGMEGGGSCFVLEVRGAWRVREYAPDAVLDALSGDVERRKIHEGMVQALIEEDLVRSRGEERNEATLRTTTPSQNGTQRHMRRIIATSAACADKRLLWRPSRALLKAEAAAATAPLTQVKKSAPVPQR